MTRRPLSQGVDSQLGFVARPFVFFKDENAVNRTYRARLDALIDALTGKGAEIAALFPIGYGGASLAAKLGVFAAVVRRRGKF